MKPTKFISRPQQMRRAAVAIGTFLVLLLSLPPGAVRAQVLFQQFTYPIENPPSGMSWWQFASAQLPQLARLGVTYVWHPVPTKGGSGAQSMGYDPYDMYDLGSKNQKGTVATRFGTKQEYLDYVAVAHANGLRVVADVVLNHAGGADQAEENPTMTGLKWDDIPDDSKVPPAYRPANLPTGANLRSWTGFRPVGANGKPGTGRFGRNWRHFHPSEIHPDRKPPYHEKAFAEDYCTEADNGYVGRELTKWGNWFRAQTGVDGFRLDAVKLIDPPFLDGFMASVSRATNSGGEGFFLVGEYWDTNQRLLSDFQIATHHRTRLIDFGLFYALRDMTTTNIDKFDMSSLITRRLASRDETVMFVSNHDVDRDQAIDRQRRALPYAIMMVMDGLPSIFYKDYFMAEDKKLPETIAQLTAIHNNYAHGKEIVRHADRDTLVIEREGNLLALFARLVPGDAKNKPTLFTRTVATTFKPGTRLRNAIRGATGAGLVADANGRVTATVGAGGYLLLVPADVPQQVLALPRPLPTTQITEFADDLDTGRLNLREKEIPLTLVAGMPFSATVSDTTGRGRVYVRLVDTQDHVITSATVARGKGITTYLPKILQTGRYFLRVQADGGTPTEGKVTVTFYSPPNPPLPNKG